MESADRTGPVHYRTAAVGRRADEQVGHDAALVEGVHLPGPHRAQDGTAGQHERGARRPVGPRRVTGERGR